MHISTTVSYFVAGFGWLFLGLVWCRQSKLDDDKAVAPVIPQD